MEKYRFLFDGFIASLIGGLAGSLVVIYFDWRQKKTEFSLGMIEKFFDRYNELSEVKGMLQNPQFLIDDPANARRVVKLGNWFDILAALTITGSLDEVLLQKIGINEQLQEFMTLAAQANTKAKSPEIAAGLRSWTNLRLSSEAPDRGRQWDE